jgi:hypothetical protein
MDSCFFTIVGYDGIVATIKAIGRALVAQEEPQPEYLMHFV